MSEINGHEYQLLKIFSSDFEYHIPAYQRPYAWTTEETNTLFDDLYGFFSSEKEEENYFLGSIVLIKETANRRCWISLQRTGCWKKTIIEPVMKIIFFQVEVVMLQVIHPIMTLLLYMPVVRFRLM